MTTCYDCKELFDPDSMHTIKAPTPSGRAMICDPCHRAEVDRITEFNLSIRAARRDEEKR